jgi:hypothetical protein
MRHQYGAELARAGSAPLIGSLLMKAQLLLHPDYICPPVERIDVSVDRLADSRLACCFTIHGDIAALQLPVAAKPQRSDDLWQHTCLEAFVRAEGEAAYREINVAPSGDWAAYRLSSYRSPLVHAQVDPPTITMAKGADWLELSLSITLDLPTYLAWHVGLCAVIETAGSDLSYWALRHAPGKADFHHDDGFALLLPGL